MITTYEELKKVLSEAGLENAAEGVVFPWGFKIVDFMGRKAIRSLTPKEYKKAVKDETGKILTDDEAEAGGTCVFANSQCYSQGCTGRCVLAAGDGYWYCICNY